MKVAATTTMTRELNKRKTSMRFEYVTFTPDQYGWFVDSDIYSAESCGDYNINTGKMRAIKVVFPDDYYAMPQYITTKVLTRLFVKGDTLESLLDRVIQEYEI